MRTPAHWPKEVIYLAESSFHASVDSDTRKFVRPLPSRRPDVTTKLVGIRQITNPAHPACGQYGLFALKRIAPKTHILDYCGELHCDDRPLSDYDLCLHRFPSGLCIGIDASQAGNEGRFINDFRGVKDKPNAVFTDGRNESGEMKMSVHSSHEGIKKGEEILVSYGKAWWQARTEA